MSTLKRRLSFLAGLDAGDWRYLLMALVQLPRVERALKHGGLRAACPGWQANAPPHSRPPCPAEVERARCIGRMVNQAAHWWPGKIGCLARSVLLARYLERLNIPATLELGVDREMTTTETFRAHAWIRCGDTVVNDDPYIVARYHALREGEGKP